MAHKVIAIAGPTAVGKTKFAIEIAKYVGGEVVSCDSMQLYKFMNIGSAKPTPEELSQVTHHLVDIIDPREFFSVAEYQKLAKAAITDIAERGLIPVISGGTGLYLNSLVYDMDFATPPGDMKYRESLWKIAEEEGGDAVHRLLEEKDPVAASEIHPNNVKRTIRALERLHDGEGSVRAFRTLMQKNPDYDMIIVGLTRDRDELYDRINRRVDILIKEGLVEEIQGLMDMGLTQADISMKGIGYKEIMAYLQGEYDLDTAIETVKLNTRHYAKKQLTWFKRYDNVHWLDISQYASDEEALEDLKTWLAGRI